MNFLIISANFYEDISSELLLGATQELEKEGHHYHKISVPGSFEIPAAISYATDLEIYDGFIALGCIIKGETLHHNVIAHESARALNELAINMNLAIGNGIITAEDKTQALARAAVKKRNIGGTAARTALKMATIRNKFQEMLS